MTKQTLGKLVTLIGALPVVLLYQNCTQSILTSSSTHHSVSSGNGQGYDGKVYVTGSCADGGTKSKIVFRGDKAFLLRSECANLQEEQQVDVLVDGSDPSKISFAGTSFGEVKREVCTALPAVVSAQPLLDISASSYLPSGLVPNAGSGGTDYDFALSNGTDTTRMPAYLASSPTHFLFDGNDFLRLKAPSTPFLDTLHKRGAKFSMTWEGRMSSQPTQALVATGSWSNSAGVGLYWTGGRLFFQVGNGDGQESNNCQDFNSLCLSGPSLASGIAQSRYFAGISLDESQNRAFLLANGNTTSHPATYSKDSALAAGHGLSISESWVYPLAAGTRFYRMRVWDQPLSEAQLLALETHSNSYCPW